ncbi:MAG TPA: type II secretion system protein F, partial [Actinomycetales bacterium]|nr:type II secretion system protein F [Actinomycetales bacterium]
MGAAAVIESLHLWIGAGLLALAVLAVLLLIATGGKTVPMSRRRPADAQSASALSRTADRATYLAGRALGDRAGSLEQSLDNAGLKATPQDFLVIVGSGMVALFALGLLVWGPIGGVLLLLAGPIVAMVVVSLRTSRRQRRFALQLDETLAILSGSLRAGYSLPQAAAT